MREEESMGAKKEAWEGGGETEWEGGKPLCMSHYTSAVKCEL